MSRAARRRTAGQRAQKNEADEPVIIQDEEEQEKEVNDLRSKNEQDNKAAWRILDGFIAVSIIMKQVEAYQHFHDQSSFLLALFLSLQGILTGSAFSPTTIAYLVRGRSIDDVKLHAARVYGTFALGIITAIGLVLQYNNGRLGGAEYIRMSMPLILHAAGWMELRSEGDMERNLENLEKSKYRMKGA